MSNFSWRSRSLSRRDTTGSHSSSSSGSDRSNSPTSDREHHVSRIRRIHSIDEIAYQLYREHEEEQELAKINRPPLQHFLHQQVWKGLTSPAVAAHLKEGKNHVLDIDCSPGIWLLEMALRYPKSVFVGIDTKGPFPPDSKASNAAFIECNAQDGIPFPKDMFDLVHQTGTLASYTQKQWYQVLKDIVRVTKPGGWVELVELDFRYKSPGPIVKRLQKALISALEKRGIKSSVATIIEGFLRDAGVFQEVKCEERGLPLGTWGGNLGETIQRDHITFFRNLSTILSPWVGVPPEQYDEMIQKLPQELNEYRTTCNYFRAYAKKSS